MDVELIKDFLKFSRKAFKNATWKSSLKKAKMEMKELEQAISGLHGNDAILEEYTDVIMCLVDSANRCGYSAQQLREAFEKKLAKNKGRSWAEMKDHTYSHVPI